MDKKLLAAAGGQAPADIVVKNGKLVNVYTKEIYEGGVAISGDKIAAVGDVEYAIGEGTEVIDAGGNYITPGFIDGHIHPESSSLSIRSFAELVLKHGTTAVMTDLHEIGVVAGLEGIEAVLEEAEATDLKLYFVVPSHVPFAPNLETSGGHFNPEIIKKALERKDAVGISEVVGPYILNGFPELMESMDHVNHMPGKTCQGHLPDMEGAALNTCLAAGVTTDHESLSGEDALARLRNGCHLMIREGSAARNMADCLKPILEQKLDTSRVSIVTDDLHTVDAVDRGHLDDAVRTALKNGVDFPTAIQMVSLNAARAFHLDDEIGGLAPGKRADLNITTGEEAFEVLSVISGGKQIVDHKKCLVSYPKAEHKPCLLNTTRLKNPITPDSFKIYAPEGAKKVRVQVMDTLPWIPITQGREAVLDVKDGVVQCDISQDVLYIAQVERYGINGNVGKAFMGGFHLQAGAIASSVGHDNHNVIVMGTNFEDMAKAVNYLIDIGGGQVVVKDGEILGAVEYPVCGLLSDLSGEELADEKRKLNGIIHELGCPITIPFMFLSFICLAAIPVYAITDVGFINVLTQEVVDPVIEAAE
ncbi:adenine deaminase [Lachnospiraceae bacterium]|jgi:adenine deaminase|uniref:Adenine deaminase n=1 Tax=Schaedlerella arabinosiphila TaxID=2044587 RepID=A0A426DNH3_9FIRM|nr:adenine deaminase C-terminal domain-containing protein [Schaedlerella arabinosiphila]NBI60379.1 adenine deaminase [Lachnospiraceae bacterium]RRK34286.1 adenine deaminase [Schaedlerella arabinosiphila]